MEDRTVPIGGGAPLRVAARAVCVTVVEGPDAGRTATSSGEPLRVGTADGNDLVLTDATVSRFHVELTPGNEGVRVVDVGSTNGTRSGSIIVERATLPRDATIRIGKTTLRLDGSGQIEVELHAGDALAGLRGRSQNMRRLMDRIERAARSDVSMLVDGESGSGKEVVARALHELSPRAAGPFVTVDCGTLAPSLVGSELFGHEKGAFTGADRQHLGAFEQAKGGTLFLDELGELPPSLQVVLLGVLERRRVKRLGGKVEVPIDVRVVSATNRDLRAEVNAGRFRLDLFYRVAVVALSVPPLRERAEDVPLLVRHFLQQCGHTGPTEELFPPARMLELTAHTWPGNVRELRNVVEAAVAMGSLGASPASMRGTPLDAGAMAPGADPIAPLLGRSYKEARATLLEVFEERYLRALLERAGGNLSRAAREGGLDRSHLTQLAQKHRLR